LPLIAATMSITGHARPAALIGCRVRPDPAMVFMFDMARFSCKE
jgi:hypothetical protein